MKPAIIAIGYNRPAALERLLRSIAAADYAHCADVPLIISLDKSDNEAEVLAVAHAFDWPHGKKRIRRFNERQGLRAHVLQCGDLAAEYGAVIVLEDDLIVSPAYYQYACGALAYYGDAPELAGVSLYGHAWNGYADVQFIAQKNAFDTYLGQFSCTWGQCWTARQWRGFRGWYETNAACAARLDALVPADVARWPETSWGKYFAYYIVENDLFYVMPYASLSTNCEEAGQHAAGTSDAHQVMLLEGLGMDWRFAPVGQAVRYDLFFERIGLTMRPTTGVSSEEVCVDLNATKSHPFGKRYLLTSARYDLPVVRTFGMRMRPVEANVLHAIPGEAIRLYDVGGAPLKRVASDDFTRLQYELYRFDWRRLLPYALRSASRKLAGRIRRLLKRS